jgi:hypothetical protein
MSSAACDCRPRTSHLRVEYWILESVYPKPRLNNRYTAGKFLQCVLTYSLPIL